MISAGWGNAKKRRKEQANDGIPVPLTKKIITVQQCEVLKQIVAEITSTSKAKEESQKESVPELASTIKVNKKAQIQNVAETISTPSTPQKSAKKANQYWSPENELTFLNGLLFL